MATLLPLADELFLVGHDHYTGRNRIDDSVLDTILAGAVLGELLLAGRVDTEIGMFVTVRDQRPYGERVSDAALAEILKRREPRTLRAWVEYLRADARAMIATRLLQAGVVERVVGRRRLRRPRPVVRYPATDASVAAGPQVRLRYLLDHPESMDAKTAVLAGLVALAGLATVVGGDSDRQTREALTGLRSGLSSQMQPLVREVESAVAQVSLSVR
jgi:hypothetical protein